MGRYYTLLSRWINITLLYLLGKPPGRVIHALNELVHVEPFQTLFYGIFWVFVLVVLAPVAGMGLFVLTVCKLLLYLTGFGSSRIKNKKELAVVVTGCDRGFGLDIALGLEERGFHVFAGCLSTESFAQFKDRANITPVQLDVTKEEEIKASVKVVTSWIEQGGNPKRFLHAIVNNAGVGRPGLVDWNRIEDFQFCLEVNLLGMIRTTKAYLSIFKNQIRNGNDCARIVNITSMAGLVASGIATPYCASKHAAEAFSNCLRLELGSFGIPVVTINPTFHETRMASTMGDEWRKLWNRLDPNLQKEYGEEYFEGLLRLVNVAKSVMWPAHMVSNQVVEAVELVNPPWKMLVGLDAKFIFPLLRMLPVWLFDLLAPKPLNPPDLVAETERTKDEEAKHKED